MVADWFGLRLGGVVSQFCFGPGYVLLEFGKRLDKGRKRIGSWPKVVRSFSNWLVLARFLVGAWSKSL